MSDRTGPAIGRTRPADGSDFFREIAAVCRSFLRFGICFRRPFGSDVCAEAGRRTFFDVSLDYLLLGKTQSTSKAASELNAAIEILERIKKEL